MNSSLSRQDDFFSVCIYSEINLGNLDINNALNQEPTKTVRF